MQTSVTVLAMTALTLSILTAHAAAEADKPGQPSAGRGQQLAERLCASCHVVDAKQKRSAVVGLPSFRAIANLPGRTDTRIRNTLVQPHGQMPDAQLTIQEIEDLLAYFDTLRKKGQGNPEAPEKSDKERPKPTYPTPS